MKYLIWEYHLKLTTKLLNTLLATYSLRNFDFLLLHTAYFDNSIIFPFLVLTAFEFLRSTFLHFKQ